MDCSRGGDINVAGVHNLQKLLWWFLCRLARDRWLMMGAMAYSLKDESKAPEFGVRYETIRDFFSPPLARSTFHDLVNKGQIIPMKGLRGFYLMNESRRRLGLREVNEVPGGNKRSAEELLRLGFSIIDRSLYPEPSWLDWVESIDPMEFDHAIALADRYRGPVGALDSVEEKLAYFHGVLDCEYASRSVDS